MKQTVNFSQFCDAFQPDRNEQFSYDGKRALFDYLEEYGESTGEEVELDIIALCCEYTEYKNLKELKVQYPDIEDMDDLDGNTMVIHIENSDGFIIANY